MKPGTYASTFPMGKGTLKLKLKEMNEIRKKMLSYHTKKVGALDTTTE